jgi:hypothetical protein
MDGKTFNQREGNAMKLVTRRGQEFEVADAVWARWERKHGARARELALTWLVMRAEHAASRAAGCPEVSAEWLASNMTATKLQIAIRRADARAGGYNPCDLLDRMMAGRITSAGQDRAIGQLTETVTDEEAEAALRAEWKETWEFSTRPLADLEKLL